jgi:dCTP deaminase
MNNHSLLSHTELCELVERGVITNVAHDQINGASIDITVGHTFLIEDIMNHQTSPILSWRKRDKVPMVPVKGSVILGPGMFCLAESQQQFNLPDDIACEYKLKSSMARGGIDHLNAGWCDPGWNGSVLTLELVNHLIIHSWRIAEGDPIGQMVFFRCAPVPKDRSYAARGRYNGDKGVSGVKS